MSDLGDRYIEYPTWDDPDPLLVPRGPDHVPRVVTYSTWDDRSIDEQSARSAVGLPNVFTRALPWPEFNAAAKQYMVLRAAQRGVVRKVERSRARARRGVAGRFFREMADENTRAILAKAIRGWKQIRIEQAYRSGGLASATRRR